MKCVKVRIMEKLRELIQNRLAEEGISNRQLADKMGMSHTMVNDVLSGKSRPGLRFYIEASRALHVPVERLLEAAGEIPPGPEEDPILKELLEIARNLSPEMRRDLRDYARWRLEHRNAEE